MLTLSDLQDQQKKIKNARKRQGSGLTQAGREHKGKRPVQVEMYLLILKVTDA